MFRFFSFFAALALVPACASPSLEGISFRCESNLDCASNEICQAQDTQQICVEAASVPIRIGMSGPLQGPSQDLGVEMRRGILAEFERVNQEGGIEGRPLELEALNDFYDPTVATQNTYSLLDLIQVSPQPDQPDLLGPESVLALLGNIGTPTMLATAPIANKNRVVFFAPFTGAQSYLRDGTNSPYVYNYRAGYYQEADAMIDYMATLRTPRVIVGNDSYQRLLAFTQNDSYGDAGYNGLVNAYNTRVAPVPQPDSSLPNPSIARVRYEREDLESVDPSIVEAEQFLSEVLAGSAVRESVAIVMIDTYLPGNKFIRAIKDWQNQDLERATRLDLLFIHVSFVGSDPLAWSLGATPTSYVDVTDPTGTRQITYADGVMVTQVVPYYETELRAAREYRQDIAALDNGIHTYTSFEGYVVARLFTEALQAAGPNVDSDMLVEVLDHQLSSIDLGIGTALGFSPIAHQASQTVWGSVIQGNGTFRVPFVWDPVGGIRPAEDISGN